LDAHHLWLEVVRRVGAIGFVVLKDHLAATHACVEGNRNVFGFVLEHDV